VLGWLSRYTWAHPYLVTWSYCTGPVPKANGEGWATHIAVKRGGERARMLDRLFRRDHGQGLVEYALIIALVAVVVIGILILLGPAIGSIFSNIKNNL
jgi:pilus assembly protein Flp/PilA